LFGASELVVEAELVDEEPLLVDVPELEEAPGRGRVTMGRSGLVDSDEAAASLARVIEIFTSFGWIPNFSRVDDTASDSAPWKLSKVVLLNVALLLCPDADKLVSDENMLCK
jgi:hypothetical protein